MEPDGSTATQEAVASAPITGQGGEQSAPVSSPSGSAAPHAAETDGGRKMLEIPADKWREVNKRNGDLKSRLATFERREPSTPSYQPPAAPQTQADPSQREALKAIADSVKAELAPMFQPLMEMERENAATRVGEYAFASELQDDIVEAYGKTDPNMRDSQRVEYAYKEALASAAKDGRLATMVAGAHEKGQAAAYEKIAEKQSAQITPGNASAQRGSSAPELSDMSPAEYVKERARIYDELGLGKPGRL